VPEPTTEATIVANDVRDEGGMERQLTELIGGLLEGGGRVTLISRTCTLTPHPRLRWVRVPGGGRPYALAYPWFLLCASLLVALRGRGILHSTGAIVLNRVDVCTVHYCHAALDGSPAFNRASRPGLAYRANAWFVHRLSLLAERWCYRPGRARALVAVSGGVAAELRQRFPAAAPLVRVIPNGVDTDHFSPAPVGPAASGSEGAGTLRALFVGGDWDRKGLGPAIESLPDCPEAELTVVGAGDREEYLRLAERIGVADRVRFAGTSSDPVEWCRRAEVFVLPTAYESFSLVTYEAAACGLALLVTRVSGVEDLLDDGRNGWFVGRDPALIAGFLRRLQANPELRRSMGAAARADCLAYSWKRVVELYIDLYSELGERSAG
jgi:glycosyltransferase involved in cell wall biosynthesis